MMKPNAAILSVTLIKAALPNILSTRGVKQQVDEAVWEENAW